MYDYENNPERLCPCALAAQRAKDFGTKYTPHACGCLGYQPGYGSFLKKREDIFKVNALSKLLKQGKPNGKLPKR